MMIMLGGRVLQGLGAGGSVVLGEIIITDLVPLHARPKWLGWLGSMWTIGGLIGPLTGGLFAELVSWRWVFWVLLPFIIGGSIISEFFLRQEPVAGLWLLKFGRVDWFGALLFLAGTVAFLVPLTCGGIIVPWSDWKILVPMFLGVDS
jgi:MFS family permease